ncbi:MAG: class I SAM-dependent methyltransferase [Clostridia bacterium]|nr:class I SAM-dependent methyltransferase [Clostridia bacterium]
MKNLIAKHYDALLSEGNDPVHDPEPLKAYMDKWDGQDFIDKMELDKTKYVLEIGVGTGRLAVRVVPVCRHFTGIDISSETAKRAEENLKDLDNVKIICDDFLSAELHEKFDVVYSSLTFMHIEEKQRAVNKIFSLLENGGRFVLSTDKNPSDTIDAGFTKIKVFPDKPDDTKMYIEKSGLHIEECYETEFANIFVAVK